MSDGPIHYGTYFDRHYLSRGVALYRSLLRHSPPFVLWILCLDDETRQTLVALGLEHARLIPLADLERDDPALLAANVGRIPVEYYWTCGPAFLNWVIERHDAIGAISYLDADLFFFGSPAPLWEELGTNSILLVEQHTQGVPDDRRPQSTYNVGLLTFRRTVNGLACLRQWRAQCLEWCFDRYEDGRFGDQGYLEQWPARFPDLTVTRNPGAGLAPWNVNAGHVTWEHGELRVAGAPAIFYHFGMLRRINRWLYELHDWRFHRHRLGEVPRRHVYAPYVRELFAVEAQIRRAGGRVTAGTHGRRAATEAERKRLAATNALPLLTRSRRYMAVAGPFVL